MSIRPLDMQVMVPKISEVAQMRQAENHRADVNQNNIAATVQQEAEKNQKTVVEPNKDQQTDQHADAKEEGKNKYAYNPKDMKKKKEQSAEPDEGYHKIDIKI